MSHFKLSRRINLRVPYSDKDEAKKLGARWDPDLKLWYSPDGIDGDTELLRRWGPYASIKTDKSQSSKPKTNPKTDRIYLAVPFEDKDEVKLEGAKWDPDEMKWYVTNTLATKDKLLKKFKINENPVYLDGEDRTFGGNNLYVDLIPENCWFTNIRYCVHPADWDRLRKHVYERVDYRCEACHQVSKDLEAHERWQYDYCRRKQKLKRLVGLCNMCHTVTHMGLAEIQGKGREARMHLKKVRNFSEQQLKMHIDKAFELWNDRNTVSWSLDLSLITKNGIKLAKTVKTFEREKIARDELRETRNSGFDWAEAMFGLKVDECVCWGYPDGFPSESEYRGYSEDSNDERQQCDSDSSSSDDDFNDSFSFDEADLED